MSTDIEFKDLWQKKVSEPLQLSQVYALANKAKRQLLIKTVLINFILCLTAVFILAIWVSFKPKLVSTKIGICFTIIAISLLVLAQNRLLPYLKKEEDHVNLNDFLEQLKTIRQKQLFIQTTLMQVYFVLLSIGVLLYMYEYVPKTILSVSISYGSTLAWFAFNWFYTRPKTIRKQQNQTNVLITKFKNLQKQLTEQ